MAVIGKIREKSYLLIIMLGLALGAFILTDSLKTCQRSSGEVQSQGSIYGEPIDEQRYNEILEEEMNSTRQTVMKEGKEMTEQDREKARDNAWNEYVRQTIMNRQFADLGIEVSTEELNDFIHGDNIHPQIKQFPIFQNKQKQFSRDSLVKFINNYLPNARPEEKEFWKNIETFIRNDRKVKKYLALINKGVYVTNAEANQHYLEENTVRNARYVVKKYADIPNSSIDSLTDEELMAYYEDHKNDKRYEMKETREIKYIEFVIGPSAEDKEKFADKFERTKKRFEETGLDTMAVANFVQANADSEEFNPGKRYKSGQIPPSLDSAVAKAKVGDVVGPIEWVNGNMALVKVFNKDSVEVEAKVRHILLSTNPSMSNQQKLAIKARADSIVDVIKRKKNFEAMVKEFSQDPGSIDSGGVYNWFPKGKMVPPFEKASFEGELGKLQVVQTQFGFHIVEPLDRRATPLEQPQYSFAVVDKEVNPSRETVDNIRNEAAQAMYSDKDYLESIDAIAKEANKEVKKARLVINSYFLPQFEKVSSIKKWAFDGMTSEGDVSEPISTGNKIIIAELSNKISEGAPDFEDAKQMMYGEAFKKKKAKVYMEKMQGDNLEQIAQNVESTVLTGDIKFSSNTIVGGGGNEPKVVGMACALEAGQKTAPIEGEVGIYVVEIVSVNTAPETSDLSAQKKSLTQKRRGMVDAGVFNALQEKAEVEDNRRRLEYNMD